MRSVLAVGAVVLRGDTVLCVRRANPPSAGLWTLPGGRVRPGETYAQALVREIREETGLAVVPVRFLEAVPIEPYVVLDWLARDEGGEPFAGDDALEAKFVPIASLADLPVTPAVLAVVHRAMRLA